MRRSLAVLGAAALGWSGCAGLRSEPENLDLRKAEIREYQATAYLPQIAAVAERAETWLERRVREARPGERLTAVFDLDDTLLSCAPYFNELNFGYTEASWRAWIERGDAPALAPVRELYRTARRLGVDVIVLSARDELQRTATERNLRLAECSGYAALLLEPPGWKGTTAEFKTAERRRLAAEGRTIILNIGDQESDLAGGFAERTFKLPDPFYLIL